MFGLKVAKINSKIINWLHWCKSVTHSVFLRSWGSGKVWLETKINAQIWLNFLKSQIHITFYFIFPFPWQINWGYKTTCQSSLHRIYKLITMVWQPTLLLWKSTMMNFIFQFLQRKATFRDENFRDSILLSYF